MTYDEQTHRDAPDPIPEVGVGSWTRLPSLRPLPSMAGAWTFCTPARPAPVGEGDPAWLVFLGVEPLSPQTEPATDPWLDLLRR